ncbi:MAG TPA: hypothetical protein VIL34_21880 [Actinopolymorphaceae bacterium]
MSDALGPNTGRIIRLIAQLREFGGSEIDRVVDGWKQQSHAERLSARAAIGAARDPDERQAALDAAAIVRREAMVVARRNNCTAWEFWAAAWDAAAAVAMSNRMEPRSFEVLVAPLLRVLPWLEAPGPDQGGQRARAGNSVPQPRSSSAATRSRAEGR